MSSCLSSCLGNAFTDKRITCVIVLLWIGISVGFYNELGAFDQLDFMTLGPSNHTKFMGAVLDTWPKWGYVASFSLLNTCINEFVNDALVPWVQNTIQVISHTHPFLRTNFISLICFILLQDHKTKALPYGKMTCISINIMFTIYTQVTMLFSMFLYMSQIDFLLLRVLGDIVVTLYSTNMFLKTKKVDPEAYAKESSLCLLPPSPKRAVITLTNSSIVSEYPRLPHNAYNPNFVDVHPQYTSSKQYDIESGIPLSEIPLSEILLSEVPLSEVPLSEVPLSNNNPMESATHKLQPHRK